MSDAPSQDTRLAPPFDHIVVTYPAHNPVTGPRSVRIHDERDGTSRYWDGSYARALAMSLLTSVRDDPEDSAAHFEPCS